MKYWNFYTLCLAMALTNIQGRADTPGASADPQTLPAPTAWRVTDMGDSWRTWQNETFELAPDGKVVPKIHKYTELASGMYYKAGGPQSPWIESEERIDAFPGGAVAQKGPHKVIFSPNLRAGGAIDIQTPDGKRLRSNILGLALYDPTTDTSVMIAEVQDSQGELVSANQVIYPDAFKGISCDIRYTYHRGGFEQEVILRGNLPDPEIFHMDPASVELEAVTEFIDPPAADIAQPDERSDQFISFGQMAIGRGKAFSLGDQANDIHRIGVTKRFLTTPDNRHILLEIVPLKAAQSALRNLPQQSRNYKPLENSSLIAGKTPRLPARPAAKFAAKPMLKRQYALSDRGYDIDYTLISSAYNVTLHGNTTYYVSGWVYLEGVTLIEPGCVIKFNHDPAAYSALDLYGNWICKTQPYKPCLLTSMDDNTVGESISGSTGSPQVITNSYYIVMDGPTNATVNNLQFRYAQYGLVPDWAGPVHVRDCQFLKCLDAITHETSVDIYLHNVLFAGCSNAVAFDSVSGSLYAENVTANVRNFFDTNYDPAITIGLTNSIVYTTPAGLWATTVITNCTAVNPTGTVFQTVGAGSYYLPTNSPFHNAGTTNISPSLLSELGTKTTYPPVAYTSVTFSVETNFGPQAVRNTNVAPDIGFCYDPIDYFFGGCYFRSNVTFNAGTAVGWFEVSMIGMGITNGRTATLSGTATAPCVLARYETVQEGGNGNWTAKGWMGAIVPQTSADPNNPPQINARFTLFSTMAGDPNHFRDGSGGQPLRVLARDCDFRGQAGGYNIQFAMTNCLFEDAWFGNYSSQTYPYEIYRNCTFHDGSVEFHHSESGPPYWYSSIQNCAFEGTSFIIDDPFGTNTTYGDYNYNAFLQGASQLAGQGTNFIVATNFNWQSGSFGNYYLPTNSPLIDAGNMTADQVGLYHFTTQTSQMKETNSVVDIGYHYVATDAYGNPVDTDGDGLADYIEDANGNGIYDAGDSGDWLLSPFNGLSSAHGLSVFTPLK